MHATGRQPQRAFDVTDDVPEARPIQRPLGGLKGHDLRVNPRLADTPGDELGDLGAEIDDQDTVLHGWRLNEDAGVRKMGRGQPFLNAVDT